MKEDSHSYGDYNTMTELAERAIHYAEIGWPVFPIVPRGKAPLISFSDGGRGFKDGTTDSELARRWWTRWPNANIGLWTRDFTVLDVDPRNHGDDSLEALEALHGGDFKDTVNVITGGGGVHYYYRGSTKMTKAGPGLDIQSSTKYVLLPPSIHPNGKPYEWEYAPGDTPMIQLPSWLVMERDPETQKIYEVEPIPTGERNETLMRIAGLLRGTGGYVGEVEVIEATLSAINSIYCKPRLHPREVHALAETARRWQSGRNFPSDEEIAW